MCPAHRSPGSGAQGPLQGAGGSQPPSPCVPLSRKTERVSFAGKAPLPGTEHVLGALLPWSPLLPASLPLGSASSSVVHAEEACGKVSSDPREPANQPLTPPHHRVPRPSRGTDSLSHARTFTDLAVTVTVTMQGGRTALSSPSACVPCLDQPPPPSCWGPSPPQTLTHQPTQTFSDAPLWATRPPAPPPNPTPSPSP